MLQNSRRAREDTDDWCENQSQPASGHHCGSELERGCGRYILGLRSMCLGWLNMAIRYLHPYKRRTPTLSSVSADISFGAPLGQDGQRCSLQHPRSAKATLWPSPGNPQSSRRRGQNSTKEKKKHHLHLGCLLPKRLFDISKRGDSSRCHIQSRASTKKQRRTSSPCPT